VSREEVFVATTSAGKLRELAELLGAELDLRPAPASYAAPAETGASYEDNARLKARALFAATGRASLGDDSGLEVDALAGAPGLLSARYAPTEALRVERLLRELRGIPAGRRAARFRAVLVLIAADGRELVAEGVCEGEIADEPRGSGGFGYDPIFVPSATDRTFAEMTSVEKNRMSHRAAAARRLTSSFRRPVGG
jgi:XTP/dITP diphosphohydrolase